MPLTSPQLVRGLDTAMTTWSWNSLGTPAFRMGVNGNAAAAWPAVGMVLFLPYVFSEPTLITGIEWMVGAAAGNVDAGLYDESGVLLTSTGTTAVAGSTAPQSAAVTAYTAQRGRYYLGIVADTTTTLTLFRNNAAAGLWQAYGCLQQTGVTLPLSSGANPATFEAYAQAYYPVAGFLTQATVAP